MKCCAPVAQLDRVPDYGSDGWGFESLQAHAQRAAHRAALYFYAGEVRRWPNPYICTFCDVMGKDRFMPDGRERVFSGPLRPGSIGTVCVPHMVVTPTGRPEDHERGHHLRCSKHLCQVHAGGRQATCGDERDEDPGGRRGRAGNNILEQAAQIATAAYDQHGRAVPGDQPTLDARA